MTEEAVTPTKRQIMSFLNNVNSYDLNVLPKTEPYSQVSLTHRLLKATQSKGKNALMPFLARGP